MPALPDWIGWLALIAVVGLVWAWWRARTRISRGNRQRQTHARDGEERAELLLEEAGYTIEERQVERRWPLYVDGQAHEVRSRADLMVSRDGLHSVAEVKTGTRAPDPTLPATRRQLMEYEWVFPVAGVLLVDVDAGCIHEVHWRQPDDG